MIYGIYLILIVLASALGWLAQLRHLLKAERERRKVAEENLQLLQIQNEKLIQTMAIEREYHLNLSKVDQNKVKLMQEIKESNSEKEINDTVNRVLADFNKLSD